MSITPHWLADADEQQSAQRASELFAAHYGYEPQGVWAAPGRVNLIGEHVDYAGGVSVPFALNQCTYVALAPREDNLIRICSVLPGEESAQEAEAQADKLGPGDISGWVGYALGPIWALRASGQLDPQPKGYDLALVSEVPLGSGLSSSAAIECAVASAVVESERGAAALADPQVRQHVISAAMRAENEVVGASTGGLDQQIAMGGQSGQALAIDFLSGHAEPVPCDLAPHNLAVLVIDSNAPHSLADGQYASRRGVIDEVTAYAGVATLREAGTQTQVQELARDWAKKKWFDPDCAERRVRHVMTEIERTLHAITALKDSDFALFGQDMYASHASLRDDYEVTVPQLDLLVDTAQRQGAIGARMTGGGFGGSAIALINEADVESTAQAIAEAFADAGFAPPAFLVATPSDGARRVK